MHLGSDTSECHFWGSLHIVWLTFTRWENKILTIWASHGVVLNRNHEVFLHRNLLDYDAASRFLSRSGPRFVPIEAALEGKGSALTIDDNTVAAADLARLAINNGHSVTLFASGRNAKDRLPYVFHTLNAVLDKVGIAEVVLDKQVMSIDVADVKSMIRRWVKDRFASLRTHDDQASVVADFARCVGVSISFLPPYLEPLSADELAELAAIGVDIENHGWEHVDMSGWSVEDIVGLIEKGQQYLAEAVGVTAIHFAVPFGEVAPTIDYWTGPGVWFLASGHTPPGWVRKGVYNRPTLKVR